MAALLALASAAAYGAADFLGGLATRRGTTVATVVVSQAAGLILLLVVLPFLPRAVLSDAAVGWGALAGLAGGVGVGLLYHGLAIGPMTVVAPTTAVCAVAVPVLAGLAFGERLTSAASSGIATAAVAIVLVGQGASAPDSATESGPGRIGRAVGIAVASGVAIGFFLVALERTPRDGGLWPLAVSRTVSMALFCLFGAATRQRVLLDRDASRIAIPGGVLDMLANVLYMIAVRAGQLSIVATLASLYPASTVLLARTVLGERLTGRQVIGIVLAGAAIVLIVAGSSAMP